MTYSINLNNFKKIAAVATFLIAAACLVPESAQAGYAKGSGESGNQTNFSFDLNVDQRENEPGFFPNAIRNFGTFLDDRDGQPVTQNIDICPTYNNHPCLSGNVLVTLIGNLKDEDFSKDVPGLELGVGEKKVSWQQLQELINSAEVAKTETSKIDFSKSVLRYDFTFSQKIDQPDMIWFIESNDSKLINDLSGLINFSEIRGIFPRSVNFDENENYFNKTSTFSFTLVPEPIPTSVPESTATSSLLGIGALGAISLLKRNKRLKKSV